MEGSRSSERGTSSLTDAALELFDSSGSLEVFLVGLGGWLGARVVLCVEVTSPPRLLAAAGLSEPSRAMSLPEDVGATGTDPPYPEISGVAERWVFGGESDPRRLLVYFDRRAPGRYRGVTRRVWNHAERALRHRDADRRAFERAEELLRSNQELQRTVEERAQELELAHRELTRFLDSLNEAQAQLVQAGKLAAVGQLAAGVAHEINNPLAVILGFAQGMARRIPEGGELQRPVAAIVRESLRCKELVQQLLTFSRTSPRTFEPIDLNEVIRGVAQLLDSRAIAQGTELSVELLELPSIRGNGAEVQQVLLNLGNNALDAVAEGGRVTLRSKAVRAGAVLEIEDSGPGIPEELRSRIFEPFFTTKEVGKGTGLGLSISLQIVERHGGSIEARSLATGTLMVVRLPNSPPEKSS
ncbi:MAG: hypothetical protein HY791_09005 [Deltaproteobacteria bacterium]|nr:hypothetical protein [Deltaproteobacteria bacterium]